MDGVFSYKGLVKEWGVGDDSDLGSEIRGIGGGVVGRVGFRGFFWLGLFWY